MGDEHDSWLSAIGVDVSGAVASIEKDASGALQSVESAVGYSSDPDQGGSCQAPPQPADQKSDWHPPMAPPPDPPDQPEQPPPAQQQGKECIVYVQKGLEPNPEDFKRIEGANIPEAVTHFGLEAGAEAYMYLAVEGTTLATCAASFGAGLFFTGPYIIVALETFQEDLPRCPAYCPQCSEEIGKSGDESTRCRLPEKHCDEHRCAKAHSWVDS